MTFEETFNSWSLDEKVKWVLGPNIFNLSSNARSIIVALKDENQAQAKRIAELEKIIKVDDAIKFAKMEQTIKGKDSAIESYKNEREHLEQRIAELESENVRLQAAVSKLETVQPKWHQCEHPDSEGFYDLPPESGEYIVQVRSRSGRLETFAADFDADYSDWPELINGTVVIQWCEEPKPQIHTAKI